MLTSSHPYSASVAAVNDAVQIAAPQPACPAQDRNETVETCGALSFSNCEQRPVASNETRREEMPNPSQKPESLRKLWSELKLRTVLLSSSVCLSCCADTNGTSTPKLNLLINKDLFVPTNPPVVGTQTRRLPPATLAILYFAQQEPPTLLSGCHNPLESLLVRRRAFANLALCSPA
jgi:hypothetical protein